MPLDRALVFKALADENRLHVVEILAGRGETCACELLDELDVTQPTLSHHMKVLCDCGLVTCRKEGRWCHYTVVPEVARELASFFSAMVEKVGTAEKASTDCCCGSGSH